MSEDIPGTNRERDFLRDELYQRFSRKGIFFMRVRRLYRSLSWTFLMLPVRAAKRLIDTVLALIVFAALFPLTVLFISMLITQSPRLERIRSVGRWGTLFIEYRFAESGWLGRTVRALKLGWFPVIWNILRGEASFVGPALVSEEEISESERMLRRRYDARPGLVCLWWLRKRGNIDYGSEEDANLEYLNTRSVQGDFGIMLRAVPAILYGPGIESAPARIRILGVKIDNLTMAETLEWIGFRLNGKSPAARICFVNADCLNIACRNTDYHRILGSADRVLADGIGIRIAGKLLGQPVRQNVNGTDLFPELCRMLEKTKKKVFFLGARADVINELCLRVKRRYPQLQICGARDGYFSREEEPAVLSEIQAASPDVLLVAFGAPAQDLWIARNLENTGARVAVGVGGLFDFYSERIPRAPLWMREIGLEWVFRLCQEPGRMWRRYLVGNGVFLFRVFWERISRNRLAVEQAAGRRLREEPEEH